MCPAPAEPCSESQLFKEPYERFMHQHLQYYGYFKDEEGDVLPLENWKNSLKPGNIHKRGRSEHESNDSDELLCSLMMKTALLKSNQLMHDHTEGCGVLRLREPRNLFSLPNCSDSVLAPLWPIECEVIQDQIHHIEWVPSEPEPFYKPTGNEMEPTVLGEENGIVVFYIDPATKGTCFTSSQVGGSDEPIRSAAVNLRGPEDTVLLFESRFESGNLQKAVRVGKYEYELTLRTDLYTSKHTQWYYFRVQNTRKDITYRFTIVNLMKAKSLYNLGMKPLLYSQKDAQLHGIGWRREGSDIRYYRYNTEEGQTLYCLTWTVRFPFSYDTCYFAHFYPYTYSDLQNYLVTLAKDPHRSQYFKLRSLCNSIAGNPVYLLTITNPSKSPAVADAKKAVILSARVHPGEPNSSWVMRGFLDFILSDSPDAQLLRDLFIFKVVPMLNPDGVIVGNYRCSLIGRDLNRNYTTVLKESFPCIWHTRAMIKRVLEEREVLLYCDLHGHSRKNNIFMYGCNNKYASERLLHERIFPLMLSKNVPDKFSFNSCKFQVQKCKEGTGRVVMWRMGILNSYTMESTFSGTTMGSKSNCHFTSEDLKSLGYHICDTILDFCDPDDSKFQQCLSELKELLKQKVRTKLSELDREQNIEGTWSDISLSDVESSTSGSDSSLSDEPPFQGVRVPSMEEKVSFLDCIEENKKKENKKKEKEKKKKKLQTRKERNQKSILRNAMKHQEDVVANTISSSSRKHHILSQRLQRNSSSEQKMNEAYNLFFSRKQQKHPDTTHEKHPELPLNKQSVPVVECELRIKEPQPHLMTMIPPTAQQSLTSTPIKQRPPPFEQLPPPFEQPKEEKENYKQLKAGMRDLHRKEQPKEEKEKAGPLRSVPMLRRHRSMWWTPEVSSVTLMLRRSLSSKSQITLENKSVWNLNHSRSQVLLRREFRWKPLKIDGMLQKEHSEYPTRIRSATNYLCRKRPPTKRGAADPTTKTVQK